MGANHFGGASQDGRNAGGIMTDWEWLACLILLTVALIAQSGGK